MSEDKYGEIDRKVDAQTQAEQPGVESKMDPQPIYDDPNYLGAGKLKRNFQSKKCDKAWYNEPYRIFCISLVVIH